MIIDKLEKCFFLGGGLYYDYIHLEINQISALNNA